MSRQNTKTLGLVIFVVVILAAFALVNPMFRFSCSRVLMHDFLGMHISDGTSGVHMWNTGLSRFLPLTLMFILWAAVALWAYRDAERRNHNGMLWGLFVFVGNVVGLIIYLILRSSSPESAPPVSTAASDVNCPNCAGPVQDTYVACPHCGYKLSKDCSQCGKRAQLDWIVCPYCGNSMDKG